MFAHSNGVVHLDLKPENIWLAEDGTAKIGDFGIAMSSGHTRLTITGTMLGTVSYMAPEQAMGSEVDHRCDLYSLGIILYELVTGMKPFPGVHPVAVINQHINSKPVAPTWHNPDCPVVLEELILNMMAKSPSDRPESAEAVLTRLQSVQPGGESEPLPLEDKRQSLRVLIVDDSEDDTLLVVRELNKADHELTYERVDTASAMKAALQNESWDAIIADHSMPDFSAPAALKILQNAGLDLPFIIVSGTINEELAIAAMNSGAHDYLTKNNLARLNPALRRELREAENRRSRRISEDESRRLRRGLEGRSTS